MMVTFAIDITSAALTVALALALCRVAGFELPRIELARVAQEAERRAVGVPVGLMDPATSLLARRGCALGLESGSERIGYHPWGSGGAVRTRRATRHPLPGRCPHASTGFGRQIPLANIPFR